MTYLVIDVETTLHNRKGAPDSVGGLAASPWHPENWIVAAGVKCGAEPVKVQYNARRGNSQMLADAGVYAASADVDATVVVGHNLRFDMHYLRRYYPEWRVWSQRPNAYVWDTQLAEYLLSGQYRKFPSLDDCAARYGGMKKNPKIQEYWESGVSTEDIPREELVTYLTEDVLNTEIVYNAQRERARDLGMTALIRVNMAALLALSDMEYNGIAFDQALAGVRAEELRGALEQTNVELYDALRLRLPLGDVNVNSRECLSKALFGGIHHYQCDVVEEDEQGEVVRYKTGKRKGKPKLRKALREYSVSGLLIPESLWQTTKAGIWSTDEKVLDEVQNKVKRRESQQCRADDLSPEHEELARLVQLVITQREQNKVLKTYLEGCMALAWPGDAAVARIHPSLEAVSTATSRYSCTKPNLQNIPQKGSSVYGYSVRQCFPSRWGNAGRLVEADLSQIEIVVQAFLSQDRQMCTDVREGVDFHCKRLAFVRGESYDHVMRRCHQEFDPVYLKARTEIKAFSFQRAYGAGVKHIAKYLELPEDTIREFIAAEEALYPRVVKMQEAWIDEVERNKRFRGSVEHSARGSRYLTRAGHAAAVSWMADPTGQRYVFVQEDAERSPVPRFRPTKIKNYAIQGLSATIIKVILAELRLRLLPYGPKALLVNTIHDSVLLDVAEEVVYDVCAVCREVFENAPALIGRAFGWEFNLPIRLELKSGPTWADVEYERKLA